MGGERQGEDAQEACVCNGQQQPPFQDKDEKTELFYFRATDNLTPYTCSHFDISFISSDLNGQELPHSSGHPCPSRPPGASGDKF